MSELENMTLDLLGQPTFNDAADVLLDWLASAAGTLISIVVIIVATIVLLRLLKGFIKRIIKQVLESREGTSRDLSQRAATLAGIIESTGRALIVFIAGLMILDNLGFSLAPLLASAGIAGLAIAFGAQSLISDTFNGFFILLEGQFGVGDFIRINGMSGTVEELSLRRTVMRSVDGAAITVPNGEIRMVENLSKGWSRAVIDIDVAPEADPKQVIRIFNEVLEAAESDPEFDGRILEPPSVLGMTGVEANRLTFRAFVKTQPLEQWGIQRELRNRIRDQLIKEGVPLPPRTIDVVAGVQ